MGFFRSALLGSSAILLAAGAAPTSSQAASILVGQCVEFATCWTSGTPTPWSDTLSGAQLKSLGSSSSLIVGQTSEYVIRLSPSTIDFTTTTGPHVESLSAFNDGPGTGTGPSNYYLDPCPSHYCEVDTVGTFTIPSNASSAVISGDFGNSYVPNSAGVCLYVGGLGSCTANSKSFGVPEPASAGMLLGALGAFGALRRRRRTG